MQLVLRNFSAILTLLTFSVAAAAQFPQVRRAEERRDQSIRADEQRQREQEEALSRETGVPRPRPAVTNVDVQMLLATADRKSFAEARLLAAEKIVDGSGLWLYIKFKSKLGDHVYAVRDPEAGNTLRYMLFIEVGPQGDPTALTSYVLQFSPADLALAELKINLAPGFRGIGTTPVFLEAAAARRPGTWRQELRLTNTAAIPRLPADDLARTSFSLELVGGSREYARMRDEFKSVFIRGTSDRSRLPVPGAFYSLPIKTAVQSELARSGIEPVRFYFASDHWLETGLSAASPRKTRTAFAVFTYRKSGSCRYGVAEVREVFDALGSGFIRDAIELETDLPLPCSELE